MDKVEKNDITDIGSLRVGLMITQDYQKPTQRALTVAETGHVRGNAIVWLIDRDGHDALTLVQEDLDKGTYDLKTTPRRRNL